MTPPRSAHTLRTLSGAALAAVCAAFARANPAIGAVGAGGSNPAPGTAAVELPMESLLEITLKGGPVMVPIAIVSLVAVAIVVERAVMVSRSKVAPAGFARGLADRISRAESADALAASCASGGVLGTVVAETVAQVTRRPGADGAPPSHVHSRESIERAVSRAGQAAAAALGKRLRALSVLASVATLLGLLGTITGMIEAFRVVAASGEALGRTELLAKGIYEAMVTTAAGLIVAIPTILAYHWLGARVELLVGELDLGATRIVDALVDRAQNEAGAVPAARAGEVHRHDAGVDPVRSEGAQTPRAVTDDCLAHSAASNGAAVAV